MSAPYSPLDVHCYDCGVRPGERCGLQGLLIAMMGGTFHSARLELATALGWKRRPRIVVYCPGLPLPRYCAAGAELLPRCQSLFQCAGCDAWSAFGVLGRCSRCGCFTVHKASALCAETDEP